MPDLVILDAGPLGMVAHPKADAENRKAAKWLKALLTAGTQVIIPEIADYEVRRELLRARKGAAAARLDQFNSSVPGRYLPLTTPAMRRAAELWAESRQQGAPTADPQALDGDVILAGQALTMGLPVSSLIVATSNVRHLARYLPAETWRGITP